MCSLPLPAHLRIPIGTQHLLDRESLLDDMLEIEHDEWAVSPRWFSEVEVSFGQS